MSELERAVQLTKELYEIEPVGGPIHIVSDDDNLDNGCLRYCWKYTNEEYSGEAKGLALEILKILSKLDWAGRYAYSLRLDEEPSDMEPFDIEEG
jgi:hypothetical protein